MENESITLKILEELLIQAPILLVGLMGLVVSTLFWRKSPAASRWCAIAFVMALTGSGLTIYSSLAGNRFVSYWVVPILRAATYIVFLIGVYAGRTNPSADSSASQQTIWQPIVAFFRARCWLKSLFRTAFVSTFLLVFVASVIITFILPESFVSSARIRLRMEMANTAGTNFIGGVSGSLDARQIETECEVIQSQIILARVVENPKLNLKERWSTKFHGGELLSTPETIDLFKYFISVFPVRNTSVIEIRFYGDRPEEIAELANALATSYRDYLLERRAAAHSTGFDPAQIPVAEIIDRARPNPIPIRPNKPLNIILGFWAAVWLAVVVGGSVIWVSYLFEKKPNSSGAGISQEWVTAQNNLGAVLRGQALRNDGVEAVRLLDEAAGAYRKVLEVAIRQDFPLDWAMAQNNLGVLLRDRAEWSQPDAAVMLLKEAVNAHRAALEVYARAQHPRYWTTTQNNLSAALRDQANRSEGAEAIRLLSEAVTASRAAIETEPGGSKTGTPTLN